MITPTVNFRYVGPSISVIESRKLSHLHIAQFKTLRLLHRTLKKNCPGRQSPWGWRRKAETHPREPRMRDAVRSTTRGFGIIGGRVYIDTSICKHAIYYTYGRRGGRLIIPVKKKALTIVKKSGKIHLRTRAVLGSMPERTKYISDTVRETEPQITKMYRDAVGVWISKA